MQVTLEEAGLRLKEIIRSAPAGEDIVITENEQPIAKLTAYANQQPRKAGSTKFGSGKDKLVFMAEDFDAPLEDFKDYM